MFDYEVKAVYEVFNQFRKLIRNDGSSDFMRETEIADLAIKLTSIYQRDYRFEDLEEDK